MYIYMGGGGMYIYMGGGGAIRHRVMAIFQASQIFVDANGKYWVPFRQYLCRYFNFFPIQMLP